MKSERFAKKGVWGTYGFCSQNFQNHSVNSSNLANDGRLIYSNGQPMVNRLVSLKGQKPMPATDVLQFPAPAKPERLRITTATSLKSVKTPATGVIEVPDAMRPGLSLRVTADDTRSWSFRYVSPSVRDSKTGKGRVRRIAVG